MQTYKIEFAYWNCPDATGYQAWDYLSGVSPNSRFASAEEANAAIREGYLGQDCDGVAPVFRVVPA
jgi:hypothetical protein